MTPNLVITRTKGRPTRDGYIKPLFQLSDDNWNEHRRAEGFTSFEHFFLRAGDRLQLFYEHNDPARSGGVTLAQIPRHPSWRIATFSVDLPTDETAEVQIEADGVYQVGIKDRGGFDPGMVVGRLVCPTLGRVIARNVPRKKWETKYGVENGALKVEQHEGWDFDEPSIRCDGVGFSGPEQLVFSTRTTGWDEHYAPEKTGWGTDQHKHYYRYYLLLKRGDILELSATWKGDWFRKPYSSNSSLQGETDGTVRVRALSGDLIALSSPGYSRETGICQDDGIYCVELELEGPLSWKKEPSNAFVEVELKAKHLRDKDNVRSLRFTRAEASEARVWIPVPRQVAEALGVETIAQPPAIPAGSAAQSAEREIEPPELRDGLNRWTVLLVGMALGWIGSKVLM